MTAIGLVGVAVTRDAPPLDAGVRPPDPVDVGWPSTLTPYLERSRELRGASTSRSGGRRVAELGRLLRIAAPDGSQC